MYDKVIFRSIIFQK